MIITRKNGKYLDLTVPKQWEGLTIEQIFRDLWRAPKKIIHQFRMDKSVLVNGEIASFHYKLISDDILQIPLFIDEDSGIPLTPMNIQILYEDDHLIIVNKPPSISTHPNEKKETNTLLNGVSYYLFQKGEKRHVRQIHRLDKDTTGAILFGKHALITAMLDQMLSERKIKRTYMAIVHGKLKKKKGTIHAKIGRDRHHPTKRRVSPTGQDAITHYEVLNYNDKKNTTLITCTLDTGRTHQIRVHLSSIGHPLVGDRLYGGKPDVQRPALHAKFLEFVHPITLEYIRVEAPFIDHPPIFP